MAQIFRVDESDSMKENTSTKQIHYLRAAAVAKVLLETDRTERERELVAENNRLRAAEARLKEAEGERNNWREAYTSETARVGKYTALLTTAEADATRVKDLAEKFILLVDKCDLHGPAIQCREASNKLAQAIGFTMKERSERK